MQQGRPAEFRQALVCSALGCPLLPNNTGNSSEGPTSPLVRTEGFAYVLIAIRAASQFARSNKHPGAVHYLSICLRLPPIAVVIQAPGRSFGVN